MAEFPVCGGTTVWEPPVSQTVPEVAFTPIAKTLCDDPVVSLAPQLTNPDVVCCDPSADAGFDVTQYSLDPGKTSVPSTGGGSDIKTPGLGSNGLQPSAISTVGGVVVGAFSLVADVAKEGFQGLLKGQMATKYGSAWETATEIGAIADRTTMKTLSVVGDVGGFGFSFAGHFMSDAPVTDSRLGHAAVSGFKAGLDAVTSKAVTSGGPVAAAVTVIDSFVPAKSKLKIATATIAQIMPTAQIGNGINGGVDAVVVGFSDDSGRSRQVSQQGNDGTYGPIVQAGSYAFTALLGDEQSVREILSQATDDAAVKGERGAFFAFGNRTANFARDALDGRNGPISQAVMGVAVRDTEAVWKGVKGTYQLVTSG